MECSRAQTLLLGSPGCSQLLLAAGCRNVALSGSAASAKPSSALLRMQQAGTTGRDRELKLGCCLPVSTAPSLLLVRGTRCASVLGHVPMVPAAQWSRVVAKQEVLGTPPVAPQTTLTSSSLFGRDIKVVWAGRAQHSTALREARMGMQSVAVACGALTLCLALTTATNPGFVVRITQAGLDYGGFCF